MSLIPKDKTPFYSLNPSYTCLYQGDIVSTSESGFLDEDGINPEYFILISKSCDLVFRGSENIVKGNIVALPLYSFKVIKRIFRRDVEKIEKSLKNRLIALAVLRFSDVTNYITNVQHVENLIDDKYSRFMFLPPDGKILKEPMIIDFEYILPIDGRDEENVKDILRGKKLELSSPFREKYAQKFSGHYSSIGINDVEIKQKDYKKIVKEHFTSIKPKN